MPSRQEGKTYLCSSAAFSLHPPQSPTLYRQYCNSCLCQGKRWHRVKPTWVGIFLSSSFRLVFFIPLWLARTIPTGVNHFVPVVHWALYELANSNPSERDRWWHSRRQISNMPRKQRNQPCIPSIKCSLANPASHTKRIPAGLSSARAYVSAQEPSRKESEGLSSSFTLLQK